MNQDPFQTEEFPVVVPDLGTDESPIRFLTWLVEERASVIPGERIAELLTQGIVWQLEATAGGTLHRLGIQPGSPVKTGDLLAVISPPAPSHPQTARDS